MGALGWSAGGHWSNWILTHTDRFKAMSEMAWMDYYVRGIGKKFSWRSVPDTLEEPGAAAKKTTDSSDSEPGRVDH